MKFLIETYWAIDRTENIDFDIKYTEEKILLKMDNGLGQSGA
jgi:hypothetical protein